MKIKIIIFFNFFSLELQSRAISYSLCCFSLVLALKNGGKFLTPKSQKPNFQMLTIPNFHATAGNCIFTHLIPYLPKTPNPLLLSPILFFHFHTPKRFARIRFSTRLMSSSSSTQVLAEYAKSKRSSCKKCSKAIAAKALRLGLVSRDARGFDVTKWHHLDCFNFGSESLASVEKIKGFQSLEVWSITSFGFCFVWSVRINYGFCF